SCSTIAYSCCTGHWGCRRDRRCKKTSAVRIVDFSSGKDGLRVGTAGDEHAAVAQKCCPMFVPLIRHVSAGSRKARCGEAERAACGIVNFSGGEDTVRVVNTTRDQHAAIGQPGRTMLSAWINH